MLKEKWLKVERKKDARTRVTRYNVLFFKGQCGMIQAPNIYKIIYFRQFPFGLHLAFLPLISHMTTAAF